ncbi:MAG: hypothetical protein OEQ16_15440, partial [Gammaproteobacteria bacterium]|nr:hypothetical protein [Gammaproteobacteria bacterium]
MNRFDALKRWTWSVFVICLVAFGFAGCEGDDGAQGPQGPAGPQGPPGVDGPPGTGVGDDPVAAAVASAKIESCGTCHSGVGAAEHQDVYDQVYNDPSKLTLTIDSVASVDEGGGTSWTVTVGFTITKTGDPLYDAGNG